MVKKKLPGDVVTEVYSINSPELCLMVKKILRFDVFMSLFFFLARTITESMDDDLEFTLVCEPAMASVECSSPTDVMIEDDDEDNEHQLCSFCDEPFYGWHVNCGNCRAIFEPWLVRLFPD